MESRIAQCNISENRTKHTLRGFHYQDMPGQEAKTILCVRGSIYDIVVDVRADSPTYLKWISFELTADNRYSLHVPKGCANAYLTLSNDAWILYFHSESYSSQCEKGIRFDDPLFSFKWPTAPEFMSEKDKMRPDFKPVSSGIKGGRI
ncbi:dTDP-4-keto-6-deoxy-D-glucose epimerase [bacterium]|nr:MAG: dTDP-4-keto-6-deoxy-D-glucose epimerase [bacterium]